VNPGVYSPGQSRLADVVCLLDSSAVCLAIPKMVRGWTPFLLRCAVSNVLRIFLFEHFLIGFSPLHISSVCLILSCFKHVFVPCASGFLLWATYDGREVPISETSLSALYSAPLSVGETMISKFWMLWGGVQYPRGSRDSRVARVVA